MGGLLSGRTEGADGESDWPGDLTPGQRSVVSKLQEDAEWQDQQLDVLGPATAGLIRSTGITSGAQTQLDALREKPGLFGWISAHDTEFQYLTGNRESPVPTFWDVRDRQRALERNYDPGDVSDPVLATRAGGVAQASFSLAAAIATAPTALTGIGAAAFLSAGDNLLAGLKTAWAGGYAQTGTGMLGSGAARRLGADDETAFAVGELTNVGVSAGSGYLAARSYPNLSNLTRSRVESLSRYIDPYTLPANGGNIGFSGAPSPARSVPLPLAPESQGSFNLTARFENVPPSMWARFPEGVPRPTGPINLLEGAAYDTERAAANRFNASLGRRFGLGPAGYEVHEIIPVKFAGSPTALPNKVGLLSSVHRQVTTWFKALQRLIEG